MCVCVYIHMYSHMTLPSKNKKSALKDHLHFVTFFIQTQPYDLYPWPMQKKAICGQVIAQPCIHLYTKSPAS
jgi:hypothetical protein